ncbi:hypothetical protein [Streptomyces sp. NPDC023588]|uniref:hypothetical protein n=1 Tax=Streptomyces sp. NPDC023588 TaxID=3154907 RepID=UPI0033D08033
MTPAVSWADTMACTGTKTPKEVPTEEEKDCVQPEWWAVPTPSGAEALLGFGHSSPRVAVSRLGCRPGG